MVEMKTSTIMEEVIDISMHIIDIIRIAFDIVIVIINIHSLWLYKSCFNIAQISIG
jgi:hypothetical protein